MDVFRLKPYLRAMERMGLGEAEMQDIEMAISAAPDRHPMVKGLGVRKARIALRDKGKSGGGRVIYYVHLGSTLYMMTAYPKSEQEDLSPDQRRALLAVIEALKGQR